MNKHKKTSVCAVIGHPIGHSLSPLIHSAAFRKNKINALYLAFDVLPEELHTAMEAMRIFNIAQYAITIPHKKQVLRYLDKIEPQAKEIGAVNTVINGRGVLRGYNTDLFGIEKVFQKVNLKNKQVMVLGNGGAAKAVIYFLKRKGAFITIFDRKRTNLGDRYLPYSKISEIQTADVVINATPVGMMPNIKECLVPDQYLHKGQIVFDLIYTPPQTELLKRAKRRGAKAISGKEMFLWQAAKQFELWTKQNAPIEIMRKALEEHLRS
ncbi:MAG: shikimate dehydrogenase [bacterium]|nr:shikimate dehydrogenase [bacterium]